MRSQHPADCRAAERLPTGSRRLEWTLAPAEHTGLHPVHRFEGGMGTTAARSTLDLPITEDGSGRTNEQDGAAA
jgi:hypothetical protein